MKNKIINWGILGCAGIAENQVIPGLLQASNANLYAIASRGNSDKLQNFKKKFNPEVAYTNYDALLDDPKVDAVYIPLPNGLHLEWVLKAAAKKKHILCEKPLGVSKEQVEQMQAVCDKNNVYLMEAFAYRQSPLTFKVKEIVDSGILGKLKAIQSNFSYFLDNDNDVRFSKPLDGGATFDIGCYNLNLIRYLADAEPLAVHAYGQISEKHGVDEGSSILMKFADGLEAFSYCSLAVPRYCHYTVIGEKGILNVPYEFNSKGTTKIFTKVGSKTDEIVVECPDNYMLEIEQFGKVVNGEELPLISYAESLGNAIVIDEALKQIYNK